MVKQFKEENLYYLKEEDSQYNIDSELMISHIDELERFSDTGLILNKHLTIGQIVEKLIKLGVITSQKIQWGSAIEDAMISWKLQNPQQLFNESYELVIELFDLAVFKNICLLTGGELNNQIEILLDYED